jgi:hypothetical protein
LWSSQLDVRHACFSHLDSGPVEIFFEAEIELVESSQFQVGHALLLVLSITSIAEGICSRHIERMEGVARSEKFVALSSMPGELWLRDCVVG